MSFPEAVDVVAEHSVESLVHTYPRTTVAVTYDYRAEHGDLLFQKVRDEPKGFRQRRPDGKGGWMGSGLASDLPGQ